MSTKRELYLLLCTLVTAVLCNSEQYLSNVYGVSVLNRLQAAISSKGCVGGICVCSELNREWSGVFSTGVSLPSVLAKDAATADETQDIQRAIRHVNRIADSMPIANRILDTCKWTRTLFSEKYSSLLEKMNQQTTEDSKVEAVKAAICELNEAVPDPEPAGDVTEVPLFLLYLRYKQEYFGAKDELARKILKEREARTDDDFRKWYQDNLEILRCDVDSAYQKWEIFGNKRKVEDLLVDNDIVADSSLITNSLGLFTAVRDLQPTTDNVAEGTMPVTLTPSGWEAILDGSHTGSPDQLSFEIGEMQVRVAELEGLKSNKASDSKPLESTLNSTLKNVTSLSLEITNARTLCRNGRVQQCNKVASLQKQLTSTSDNFIRDYVSYKSTDSVDGVKKQIQDLQVEIGKAEVQRRSQTALSTTQALDIPEGVQQVSVMFNWTEDSSNLNATFKSLNMTDPLQKRPFLYIQSPPDEGCTGCYDSFQDDVVAERISAKLYFLTMERSWFDPTVLQKAYMKKIIGELSEPYSPSATSQSMLFDDLARRDYLLPFYPTSMVMATDIVVTLKTTSSEAVGAIYKAAWSSSPVKLGIGPFSVVSALEGTYNSQYRYSIENINNEQSEGGSASRLKVRLAGGQIIGMRYQMMESVNVEPAGVTLGPLNITVTPPPGRHRQ
uniref:IgGFc-binding protein-like protein 2 n=1 Tax=Halisarca dujardinii TaxID=2583056 RepID=A0AA96MI20_HALDU|nr:IgGFc-binding protein-like protein 2 [Halisarca dujardinii]